MGKNNDPREPHSKFTPTGNEQGSAQVQPDGQRETPDSRPVDPVEQRGGQDDGVADSDTGERPADARGLFSALVGDGKQP